MDCLLIPAFALLNCFRGRGWVSGDRIIACLGMGLAAGLATNWPLGLIVAAGLYLWALPGWGEYFSAVHGRAPHKGGEIRWIDWIGYRLFPWNGDPGRNRIRGTLQMSLRGLYMYPLFAVLAFLGTPWALLIGLGCLLQGPCYWFIGNFGEREYSIAAAELLFGAAIGAMIVTVFAMGGA